eukprot:TRINITY_DN15379_c0_g1_i10.p1 TRINITY_DN15379_c0_g1~~TRINITY_DN15379_c0_g1_i10.p1  ORF type:complete len:415 (+),score=35.74 TRINITY_DN15379_c0_g1_i10:277-1521(+)
MDLTKGTTHVAVGYVDLGQLLNAHFHDKENPSPLKFVGYEQSVYCTAKSLVIGQMLQEGLEPESILQVWYSSGWSSKTLDQFRMIVGKLLQQKLQDQEVEELLRYWLAAPRVSLKESQRIWLRLHKRHQCLAANALKEQDRIELCSYSLTGRLLQCDVGSVVMFANPPSFPHIALDETVMWQIKEHEVQQNYEQYGSILGAFVGLTISRISKLGEKISSGQIELDLRRKTVSLDDVKTLKEIKATSPYTISWSNLVDYCGSERFHKMARQCSAESDTIHFMHSMNWIQEVKGASVLDYPLKAQQSMYERICNEVFPITQGLRKDVLLSPPIDNPYNVIDGFITIGFCKNWAQAFFDVGKVQQDNIAYNYSLPYSLFCRAQGNLYICYTYDSSLNFDMQVPEGMTDQDFLAQIFG